MTAPREAAEPRNRLPLLAGGGAGLILLLLLATKVAGGGGGGSPPAVREPAPRALTTVTTAAPAGPAAPPEAAPVETFEVFNTKNPFTPLRGAATASSATAAPAPAIVTAAPAPVVATPVAVTTPPAATATTVAPAPVQDGTTGGQATAPVRTTRVALLDVFAEGDRVMANVRVNDTVSKVAAGDTFSSNFKVVSLDSATRCGRFLFGDDQFQLCRGEEVLK